MVALCPVAALCQNSFKIIFTALSSASSRDTQPMWVLGPHVGTPQGPFYFLIPKYNASHEAWQYKSLCNNFFLE